MTHWLLYLAQAFPGQIAPSSKEYGPGDLTFLRFPQASPEQITWFLVVIMGVVLVAIGTLGAERLFQDWREKRPRRNTQKGERLLRHMEPEFQGVVDRLVPFSGGEKSAALVQDVSVFETAVHQMIAAGQDHDLLGITKLRRHLHMTAMNSNIEVVSTRQLMADLPVRLSTAVGNERIDLYCSLLEVNERFFLIDLPYNHEVYEQLTQNPEVTLLYWRQSGERPEVPFRVHLEPLQAGQISAFRCRHALVSEELAQRTDFRLTVDWPITYQFLSREQLVARKQSGEDVALVKGEARLIDLSQSGAAFLTDLALTLGGFAQLNFVLRDTPLRVMLEVLDQAQRDDGRYLVRGHFRGMSQETRSRLQTYLSREQIKRLQLKEAIVQRIAELPGAAAAPGGAGAAAVAEAEAEAELAALEARSVPESESDGSDLTDGPAAASQPFQRAVAPQNTNAPQAAQPAPSAASTGDPKARGRPGQRLSMAHSAPPARDAQAPKKS